MDFFMNEKKLKGIYLHGYKGYVTEEKHLFLNQFGDIYHPTIDYDNQPTIVFELYEKYRHQTIDFVAGTSLGGILIYHLAKVLDVPVLLLNPAVTALPLIQEFIPKEAENKEYLQKTMVIVGAKDDIVSPILQLKYFEREAQINPNIQIIERNNLGHFVPIKEFTEAFTKFKEVI